MVDIGTTLELLATAVRRRGRGASGCLVGQVLADAGVRPRDIEALRGEGVRDLYRAGRLPISLTLGAVAVLDAAQRSEARGRPSPDVLADATATAVRVLDLMPDTLFDRTGRRGLHLVPSLGD